MLHHLKQWYLFGTFWDVNILIQIHVVTSAFTAITYFTSLINSNPELPFSVNGHAIWQAALGIHTVRISLILVDLPLLLISGVRNSELSQKVDG